MINIQITTSLFIFQSFPIALFNYFIMFFFKYLLAVSIKLCIQFFFIIFRSNNYYQLHIFLLHHFLSSYANKQTTEY